MLHKLATGSTISFLASLIPSLSLSLFLSLSFIKHWMYICVHIINVYIYICVDNTVGFSLLCFVIKTIKIAKLVTRLSFLIFLSVFFFILLFVFGAYTVLFITLKLLKCIAIYRLLYRVQIGTFIEHNISYKISINYCAIKTPIVIILRTILNTAHCYKYVQWAYYNFPNTFNWYLTTQMSTHGKQKMAGQVVGMFSLNLFVYLYNLQNYKIFLPHPSKRNQFGIKNCTYQRQKSTFLFNTS